MLYSIEVNNKSYKYLKAGKGDKNLFILPGVSITKVLKSYEVVERRFSSFGDEFTYYLFERNTNITDKEDSYDIAKDYVDVMDYLGIDKVYLCGVSFGGTLSQIIASNYPDRVVKCALVSTTSRENPISIAIGDKWSDIASSRDFKKLNQTFVLDLFSKETIENNKNIDLIGNDINEINDESLENFKRLVYLCFHTTVDISKIKCKTIVFASYNDKIYPYTEGKYIAETLNSKIVLYEKYGHAVYDETDDVINKTKEFYLYD